MNKAFCTECGAKYLSDEAFCTACGAPRGEADAASSPSTVTNPIPTPMPDDAPGFCTSCGAKRNPGERFCTECGASFGGGTVAAGGSEQAAEESDCGREPQGEAVVPIADNQETAPLPSSAPARSFAAAAVAEDVVSQEVFAAPIASQEVETPMAPGPRVEVCKEGVAGAAEPKRKGRKGAKIAACVAIAVVLVAGGGIAAFAALGNGGWVPEGPDAAVEEPQTDALAEEPADDDAASEGKEAVEDEVQAPSDAPAAQETVKDDEGREADVAANGAASGKGGVATASDGPKDSAKGETAATQPEPQEASVPEEPPLSLDDEETRFLVNRYLSNFTEQPALSQGYDADDIRGTTLFTFAQLYIIKNVFDSVLVTNQDVYINWADMQYYTDLMLKTELTTSMIPGSLEIEDGYVRYLSIVSYGSVGVASATEMEKVGENLYAVNFDVYGDGSYDVLDESFYRMTGEELGEYFGQWSARFSKPVAYGTAIIETGYDDTPAAPYKLLYFEFNDLVYGS